MNKTMPDFARQRRDLLRSIQLTLVERIAAKGIEEQLAYMFRETAAWLRLPAGVAAAGVGWHGQRSRGGRDRCARSVRRHHRNDRCLHPKKNLPLLEVNQTLGTEAQSRSDETRH